MRLFLLTVCLVSAFTVFSQPKGKITLSLPDSFREIDIADNLYKEINSLEDDTKRLEDDAKTQMRNYNNLEEFCMRQNVYRSFFDKLELGGKPGSDSLSFYYKIIYGPLFNIPDSGKGFPVTVYYQSADTTKFSAWEERIHSDFANHFLAKDTLLLARYPRVYNMWKQEMIVFESAELGAPVLQPLQVPKFVFPAFYAANNTTDAKKALADQLLTYISQSAPELISSFKRQGYDVDGDIIEEYVKLEQQKYAKATLDEKIGLRRKFIEYLKMLSKKYE